MHSVSGREHLFRWNSRHTSSCSQRESFPFRRLFMFTMVAIVGSVVGAVVARAVTLSECGA